MIYNTIVRVVADVSADTPEQAALQLCESLAEAGFTAYRNVDAVPSLVQNPQDRTPDCHDPRHDQPCPLPCSACEDECNDSISSPAQAGDTVRFRTVTDSELRPRNGTTATVTGVITEPDDDHDAEVLPMYRIRFADGHETEAFGDELHETGDYGHVTDDMFDGALENIVSGMTARQILAIPGTYEVLSETLNNDVLATFDEQETMS